MRVLVSWSSGKDSAWALHTLRSNGTNVVGLLTTLNEDVGRVSMQGVRRQLLHAQRTRWACQCGRCHSPHRALTMNTNAG
jgi:diphthamide synthase (EF-2-diphthine--ammonia ligase)